MKRKLLFFAMLCMAAGASAQNYDFSATASSGQTLYYKILTSNTVSVVYPNYNNGDYWSGYTKPSLTLTIPSMVSNNGTTYTVTSVGDNAFCACASLEYVNMPTTLTSIGDNAFYNCSYIYHIVVPEGVTSVGDYAFYGLNLAYDVTLPSTLTHIGAYAFYGVAGISELTIPRNVQYIGNLAFATGSQLSTLNYCADSCTIAGNSGTPFFATALTTLNIGDSVRHIPASAFAGLPLTSVTIPASVTSIGDYAFQNCTSLVNVSFGANVESIGNYAFSGCTQLTAVNLPTNIRTVGRQAFQNLTHITSVTFPRSLESIGHNAFNNCPNLTNVIFNADNCFMIDEDLTPNGITQSDGVFTLCSHLTTATFGNNVKRIPAALFAQCPLVTVQIPDSVKIIGKCAFYGTPLQTVHFGNGLEGIGDNAFTSCSHIASVSFPSSLRQIGDNAFYGTGLTSVSIPQNIGRVGAGSFWGCSNLDTLYFNADSCSVIGFEGAPLNPLYGPEYTSGTWNYRPSWRPRVIFIGNNVKALPPLVFKDCEIKEIVIPNSVKNIGIGAFVRCDSLSNVTMGTGVDSIFGYAFYGCSSLSFIVLPDQLDYIGDQAFDKSGLTTITLPASISAIGQYFLQRCDSLAAIYSLAPIPPTIDLNTFRSANGQRHPYTLPLYVTCTALDGYRNATHWSMFDSINLISGNRSIQIGTANAAMGIADYVTADCEAGSITIQASPAAHYRFCHWSDGSTSNPRSLTLTQDTVLIASFEKDTFVVTALSLADSLGSVIGGGTYFNGDTARIYAFANGRSWFDSWSDNSTENPLSFIVEGNVTVTASFALPPRDTTYIDNYIHDTTIVTDYIHDTTIVDNWIFDTTIVVDTITLTEYVQVHDTTYVSVHDTTLITLTDTVFSTLYDTVYYTIIDTLWLTDTVYIHDTVYVSGEGIEDATESLATIYQRNGQVVVEGTMGEKVVLFDVVGRQLAVRRDYSNEPLRFDVPATGAYLVKIGNRPARRIVVVR